MRKRRLAAQKNALVQFKTKTITGKGIDRTETWATTYTEWVFIRPIFASEIIKSNREEMTISHRIKMDYRTGILPSLKIVWGSREFDINSVFNIDEANREIEILATEVSG